jgi:hypothetical protein
MYSSKEKRERERERERERRRGRYSGKKKKKREREREGKRRRERGHGALRQLRSLPDRREEQTPTTNTPEMSALRTATPMTAMAPDRNSEPKMTTEDDPRPGLACSPIR